MLFQIFQRQIGDGLKTFAVCASANNLEDLKFSEAIFPKLMVVVAHLVELEYTLPSACNFCCI